MKSYSEIIQEIASESDWQKEVEDYVDSLIQENKKVVAEDNDPETSLFVKAIKHDVDPKFTKLQIRYMLIILGDKWHATMSVKDKTYTINFYI